MVLLQEQSLYSLGEPTVPAGECRSRDGMPALHCLWASQWALILINGNPQEPSTQAQLKWRSSTKGPFFGSPGQSDCYQTCSRANLGYQIVTAHSWQEHHTFPPGLTDPLASWRARKAAWHMKPHPCHLHSQRGFSSYAEHSFSSLTTFLCCQESCLALSFPQNQYK